jgi:hypothetical protein
VNDSGLTDRPPSLAQRLLIVVLVSIPIGCAIELALEICTSLDRYGATLPQAISAAYHSAFMPHELRDSAICTAITIAALAIREVVRAKPQRQRLQIRERTKDSQVY